MQFIFQHVTSQSSKLYRTTNIVIKHMHLHAHKYDMKILVHIANHFITEGDQVSKPELSLENVFTGFS